MNAVQTTFAANRLHRLPGHGGEPGARSLASRGLVFARQDPPRGTGDAVRWRCRSTAGGTA